MQRPEEPITAAVPGEYPPGAVGAMCRRSQADDEDGRVRITEAGHGAPPIDLVGVRRAPFTRDLLSPCHEPTAGPAIRDRLIECGDRRA